VADPYNRERSGGSLCQGRISAIDVDQVDKRDTTSDGSYRATAIRALDKGVRRQELFRIVPKAGIRTQTVPYPLVRANEAFADLRSGGLQSAAVLVP